MNAVLVFLVGCATKGVVDVPHGFRGIRRSQRVQHLIRDTAGRRQMQEHVAVLTA